MKQYTIKLTEEEKTKLTTFLIMYEDKLLEAAEVYEQESKAHQAYNEETIRVFTSNAAWYREAYKILHNLKNELDNLPF